MSNFSGIIKVYSSAGRADENYVKQVLSRYDKTEQYERYTYVSSGNRVFSPWVLLPSRAEVDALNSKLLSHNPTVWTGNIDLNTLRTTGRYFISRDCTNVPGNSEQWFVLFVTAKDDTVYQEAYTSDNSVWVRRFMSNAWSDWIKQPTRAEVNALNNIILKGSIESNSSQTLEPILQDGCHTLTLKRSDDYVSVCYDWWSSEYKIISGSIPTGITITKNSSSHNVTVASTRSTAISFELT